MSKTIYIFFFLLFALPSLAQIQPPPLRTNSKKAVKHFDDARENIKRRLFDEGISDLQKAIKTDPNFFDAYFLLANTYKSLRVLPEAEQNYRKCAELGTDNKSHGVIYYEVGMADFQQGKYEIAKSNLQKYLDFKPGQSAIVYAVKKAVECCDYAVEGIKKPVDFKPKPLPKIINSRPLQYFAVLSADQETMIFTARDNTTSDENILVSKKVAGEWITPEPIKSICTITNEGTCSISADGKIMIFTACAGSEYQVLGSCDLFVSYKKGNEWQKPFNLGKNINSKYWDTQPSLSADGRTIYFVSDRPGGEGGVDIWRSRMNEKGVWQPAENMGDQINTRGNEYAPFIHVNGRTLYFASDGYIGYGGTDLYKTELENNEWTDPENLGYPLNDHRNQVGLFISPDGKKGYYSHEDIVSSNIYEFEVPKSAKSLIVSNYVKGVVYDAKTKQKLQAKIELYNLANDSIESSILSDQINGDYLIVLNEGAEYALYVNKENYLFQSLAFNYTGSDGKDVTIDVFLEPVVKGSAITLNNIFFETAKWDLQEKSKTELNKLLKFFNENPNLKVEISGHTDDRGSDDANQKLSQQRAQSVINFLIDSGVAKERMLVKGYGETKPLVANDTEENRAKNRRIEFKIL
ncbi:MAG: hypothetical protein EAZ97_04880 [Bacteroidetes bacterium]|nr:MAG: hypothetical protein EAZ97_04880 [Bacteroidota bacterium]